MQLMALSCPHYQIVEELKQAAISAPEFLAIRDQLGKPQVSSLHILVLLMGCHILSIIWLFLPTPF